MGDFVGHIDESIVFLILANWWMYNGFTNYIKSTMGIGKYSFEMSYFSWIRGRKIPLELMLKFLFPLGAFFGEVGGSKMQFLDEDGNFLNMNYVMHMSIYGFFVVHAIMDILSKYKIRWLPPKIDFISGGLAFFWYALGVSYHVNPMRPPLENRVHNIPLFFIYTQSVCCFLATIWSNVFIVDMIRCFSLALVGSWFFQVSFIMYKPGILGREPNWNRTDMPSVHMVAPIFAFHMMLVLIYIVIFYGLCFWLINKTISQPVAKYENIKINRKQEESALLIENSD